jgi:hypothetical protein
MTFVLSRAGRAVAWLRVGFAEMGAGTKTAAGYFTEIRLRAALAGVRVE